MWNLYNKQVAHVRIGDSLSTTCIIGSRVRGRQGSALSPLLYLIYDEAIIREATDNLENGISVGGRIRYADDKAVVAKSEMVTKLTDNLNVTRV